MKKKLSMIFVSCVALSMVIGCNVFGAEAVKNEKDFDIKVEKMKEDKEEYKLHEKGALAKVVAVNQNTLVVNLAEKPERPEGEKGEKPERPEGEEGERPQRPEGEEGERPEKPEGEKGERPEKPEGEKGERPERPERPEGEEGERPQGHGMMKEMSFNEEEVEIALNENIVIHLDADTEGSIEDIAADDIVMISYEEDGTTVKGIFVMKK